MPYRCVILAHRTLFSSGLADGDLIRNIRQHLEILQKFGSWQVTIVDGDNPNAVERALYLADFPNLSVTVVANPSWKKATGSALMVAAPFIETSEHPVLVLRGDRPIAPDDVEALLELPADRDAALLIAPSARNNLAHEFKVVSENDVLSVAKRDLPQFAKISTGHSIVRPSIVDEIRKQSNPSLESVFNRMGNVQVVESQRNHDPAEAPSMYRQVDAILSAKTYPKYTLLNPGPVVTTSKVKAALVHHDVCHRDGDFSELMVSLTKKLRRIFKASADYTTVLITGSGTSAMESAICSSVPEKKKILVVDNGAFGERLLEVANTHSLEIVHLRYAWGEQVNPEDIEQALVENPDIEVVAMVHHETSVGLLNPITQVGRLCRKYDVLFIVDAVSSLGAENLDVERDCIDICYGSANKCLHAVSGAAFLCVSPRTWKKINGIRPRSYYLDLRKYRDYVQDLAQTPFTPAVSAYFALDAACDEFLLDGHEHRWSLYRKKNNLLRNGLAQLGMVPFTRTGEESNSIVTCSVPAGIQYEDFYRAMKRHGFIVYGCKGVLKNQFLQVANMGDLRERDIQRFLDTAKVVIEQLREKSDIRAIA